MSHQNTHFIRTTHEESLLWFQDIIRNPMTTIKSIQSLNHVFEKLITSNSNNPINDLKMIISENDEMNYLFQSIFDLLLRIDPNISYLIDQNDSIISNESLNDSYIHSSLNFKLKSPKNFKKRALPDRWSPEESELLKQKVLEYEHLGKHKWSKISQIIKTKTAAQCAQRWTRVMHPDLKKGKWDPDEEEKLFKLVEKYGANWKQISSELKNRSDIQCRYAYKKAIESRNIPWTEKDDKKLIELVRDGRKYPLCNWSEISTHFRVSKKNFRSSRTALECRERWLYLGMKEE